MIGKIIGFMAILFLGAFAVTTVFTIIKELIYRKRAAVLKEQNTDEKEGGESTD